VKKEIGITSLNTNSLNAIIQEIERLKKAKMSAVTEEREYNDEIAISNFEQKEYIASLNNNARQFKNEFTLIENYQKTNNKFRVEIHKKFTLAIACILFTLVGAPLGMLVRNGGMTIASGLSIAFFLIYYILLIWGEQLADRNLINPGLGSWLPNIVLFISGMIILKQSNKRN
jgi:lipopolysaccharide export system permease protein